MLAYSEFSQRSQVGTELGKRKEHAFTLGMHQRQECEAIFREPSTQSLGHPALGGIDGVRESMGSPYR